MSPIAAISHAELGEALSSLRFGVDPSDLHGSLCGYLCAGGADHPRGWMAALEIESEDGAGDAQQRLLERVSRACRQQLDDPELGFEPLLPDEDEPLRERADALVHWCRGFLGGLGLAGISAERGLSPDGAEILRDFSTIAGTRFEYKDAEEDENALSEVVEFIRVGVLLVHTELCAPPAASATRH
jgi:uncharacterized protein